MTLIYSKRNVHLIFVFDYFKYKNQEWNKRKHNNYNIFKAENNFKESDH